MKIAAIISLAFIVTATAQEGTRQMTFEGWNQLKEKSADIVMVRCTETPIFPTIHHGALIKAKGDVISVLKGTNALGAAVFSVSDERWPKQGEYFLFFAFSYNSYGSGTYLGNENYRVIPLGVSFPSNILVGKSLDEQIQAVLKYRVDMLNQQIKKDQEEKQRLEEGLKK